LVKFVFSYSKLRKQPFFVEIFKIQKGSKPPTSPPSDAHGLPFIIVLIIAHAIL